MSAVDSNNLQTNANKEFHEKKAKNDELFVALCFKDLYAAIDMHFIVMQKIEKAREQTYHEEKNKEHFAKEESSYRQNLENYNESIKKLLAKAIEDKNIELANRIKSFLDNISNMINELNSRIHAIDLQLTEIGKKIDLTKDELAKEIKQFFSESNSDINIRSQSFSITLVAEKINIDIGRKNYLTFANRVGEGFGEKAIDFHLLLDEAKQIAAKMINDEILLKLAHLLPDQQAVAIRDIQSQNSEDIDRIARQLVNQFVRDMSKQPAMASLVKVGCCQERLREKLLDEREALLIKRDKYRELADNVAQSLSSPSSKANPDSLQITLLAAQAALTAIKESSNPLFDYAATSLKSTDDCVNKIEELTKFAKEAKDNDPATPKVAESLSKMPEITRAHQLSISESFDDFFENDHVVKAPLQSDSPSMK